MKAQQAGFTLVEVSLVSVIIGIAIGMISTCFDTSSKSLMADDLVARSMEKLQQSVVHVSQFLRPCSLTTYRVMSTAADVPLAASAAGEWIEPTEGQARAAIRFRSSTGQLAINASAQTELRSLQLRLESGEVKNGADDDGDGMIDEGELLLDYDGTDVVMARDVESVSFTLTGRLLAMRLQVAARRRDGALQRFSLQETVYLRNN